MVISSIDIGTNTVLLLIAETNIKNNKIIPLLNEYRIPRIGKNVNSTNIIAPESVARLIEVLLEFKSISSRYNSTLLIAAATSGFRQAKNSEEVIKNIFNETGISINIISGEQEAIFAYLGVSDRKMDNKQKLIIDIGGGSTELILGASENIIFNMSFDIGAVSLAEKKFNLDEVYTYVNEALGDLNIYGLIPELTYAIAGTPAVLASIKMQLPDFNEKAIEGAILETAEIGHFIKTYSSQPENYMIRFRKILSGREDLIIPGSVILWTIMNKLNIMEVVVSTKGIRHGIIIDYLNSQG